MNTIGASATVAVLGVVIEYWAWSERRPGGVVVGAVVLVLAAAILGAGLGLLGRRSPADAGPGEPAEPGEPGESAEPGRGRRRVVVGALVGLVVGVVVASAAIGTAVARARALDPGGTRAVELYEDPRQAWVDGDTILAVTETDVLAIADDGTIRVGEEADSGTPVLVPAGPGEAPTSGVVMGHTDDEVEVRDRDGAVAWRAALTVDDQPAGRVEVVAADAEGRLAVRACVARRCDIVGLDDAGDELWRRTADDLEAGVGRTVVDVPEDPDMREAPPRLVVVDSAAEREGRAVELDMATGEETDLGATGEVAVVGDVVAIARLEGDRCEVGIVRGDAPEETVPVPSCIGGALVPPSLTGPVVVFWGWEGALAVDTASGQVATVELGGVRTTVTGDGLLVVEDRDGTQLRDLLADTVVGTFDGWSVVGAGPDGVVLERDRESDNPFARGSVRETAVVDPGTGEICARLRLDVTFVSRASPLPGCRAVIVPSEGPALLVG